MAEKKKKTKNKSGVEKFWGAWNVAEAILLMVAGILAIVVGSISVAAPDNQGLQDTANVMANIVPFVTGVFVVMDAIMRVILSFTKFKKETDESAMMIGAFEATVGIILMIFFQNFTELVADFVAIFMICIGVLLIVFSIFSIAQRKAKIFIPILEIIFSAILIGVGVAILIIYYQGSGNASRQRLVLIITGAILFITGIVFLVMTRITRKKQDKEKKEEEERQRIEEQHKEKEKLEHNDDLVLDYTEEKDDNENLPVVDDNQE